jgi:hypothetical protein
VVGISTIASLEDADVVVTDAGLHADAVAVLTERVGDVMIAPTAATTPSLEVS